MPVFSSQEWWYWNDLIRRCWTSKTAEPATPLHSGCAECVLSACNRSSGGSCFKIWLGWSLAATRRPEHVVSVQAGMRQGCSGRRPAEVLLHVALFPQLRLRKGRKEASARAMLPIHTGHTHRLHVPQVPGLRQRPRSCALVASHAGSKGGGLLWLAGTAWQRCGNGVKVWWAVPCQVLQRRTFSQL